MRIISFILGITIIISLYAGITIYKLENQKPKFALPNDEIKKEKTFTATFKVNGELPVVINTLSCTTTEKSCKVKAPSYESTDEVLGWGLAINATKITKLGEEITLTKDATYYVITRPHETTSTTTTTTTSVTKAQVTTKKTPTTTTQAIVIPKTFTATFILNGADSIGAESLSCTTNGASCTVIAPAITTNGVVIGWGIDTAGSKYLKVGSTITLSSNMTFYAIVDVPRYIDARAMMTLINNERVNSGLIPLTFSDSLTESAKIRAEEACRSFSHTRPDGSSWSTVSPIVKGENLAAGTQTIETTHQEWMNSQGHKENIIRDWFRTVGIIGYYCPTGPYKYYWAQLFGQ